MANPQYEEGFAKLANEILDHIAKASLNGSQLRIVIAVWRYTYGFSRKEHELSIEFLAQATEMHPVQVRRELKTLIARKVITVQKEEAGTRPRLISFNKDYDQWIEGTNSLPLSTNRSDDEKTNPLPLEGTNQFSLEGTNPLPKKEKRKKEIKPPRQSKKYDEGSTYFKMAHYFQNKLIEMAANEEFNHASIGNADLQKWADIMRLMVENDKVDKRVAQNVMDWVVTDPFWKTNVLSAKTLREKFPQLVLKMKSAKKPGSSSKFDADKERLQKMYEDDLREEIGGNATVRPDQIELS